jgi:hypothetical protein
MLIPTRYLLSIIVEIYKLGAQNNLLKKKKIKKTYRKIVKSKG